MRSIFESAKSILEKTEPGQDKLDALTKVMLSTKHSYSVINAVRAKLDTPAGDVLLGIVSVIAGNTSLFNAFVTEFKKGIGVTEETIVENEIQLTEEEHAALMEDRLQSDIKSLKRIGWKLDKVIPFMVTKGDEYGVKMTSDLITMYYNDGGAKKKLAPVKVPKPKKVSWPKDPPKSKLNDPQHAEAYLGQVIDSDESPDMTGSEAFEILRQAGYTEHAIMWVIRNLGWEGDLTRGQGGTKIAKKTAPKFRK